MRTPRIAIIGGGVSGLYAAFLLQQQGMKDYALFEAREKLGRRIPSTPAAGHETPVGMTIENLDRFDLGPTWSWPDIQHQLGSVIGELGIPCFEQYQIGDMMVERSRNQAPVRVCGYTNEPVSMRLAGGMAALTDALAARLQPKAILTLPSEAKAALVSEDTLKQQRKAISAEADKIHRQRIGLAASLEFEETRLARLTNEQRSLSSTLAEFSRRERQMIAAGIDEFGFSATELAEQKTFLYTQLPAFKEITRLTAEAARLESISAGKNARIERQLTQNGMEVSKRALELIDAWGLEVSSVSFDASSFDIKVHGRKRTSFGQGVRALFLTAFYVALLEHAERAGRPHPGFAVVDSPLKNCADKEPVDSTVPLSTVRTRFYTWLSTWSGPGQLIVLENERPPLELHGALQPTEFTKIEGVGRRGLFPNQ